MTQAGEKVIGIVTNLVPYHHARWEAFARMSQAPCQVIELTNKDEFSVLEMPQISSSPYERITLFPQTAPSSLSPASIHQKISHMLDHQRPTCVCLNGYASPLALGALIWCLRHEVPTVLMSESTEWDEPRNQGKEWLKARIVRLCSSALVGGAPHAEYLVKLGLSRERIFLGYDVIDNEHFDLGAKTAKSSEVEMRKRHGLPERFFLASARFAPKKNLPRLIEAYDLYRKSSAFSPKELPWDMVILGDGEGRESLLKLRSQLGLEGHVYFAGAQPYEDLPAYCGLASAFIHASTTEPWGLVVNEAMASGLPVLVSNRCGCAQDLVQEGVNGFTFDPYDIEDIAGKMIQITTSATQLSSLGKASRDIIKNWSTQQFAQGLAKAIDIALAAPVPRSTWFHRLLISLLIHR